MAEDYDEREEELSSITAIYPELTITDTYSATLDLPVAPTLPLLIRFVPQPPETAQKETYAEATSKAVAHIERDVKFSHLPPLRLHMALPEGYPSDVPPTAQLRTEHSWLPKSKLRALEREIEKLWEEYGRCQILYSYIDFLQQASERGFDLDQSAEGCLTLSSALESPLVAFNDVTKLEAFNAGSYDCGICLEPKKGSSCYKLDRCSHVFCRQCLQEFYNDAIKEGNVATVRCLDPSCSRPAPGQKTRKEKPLHPREMLAMGLQESVVRRYVEMKRKKKLESDKNTIYCPRDWCQNPARSQRYPPIPANLADYPDTDESDDESKAIVLDPSDRLSICENPKCNLAFCRVCYKSWHGPYARCHPRNPNELSEEEKASYEYIAAHTSPCPTCNSPTQKTMGCNHMICAQCQTHFCYLCGAWLESGNPYQHFNKAGTECSGRLWELEEGDEGQGPEGGNGFRGARRWEQMAIEVAREADEAEARRLQAMEDEQAAEALAEMRPVQPVAQEPVIVGMAQINIEAGDQEPPQAQAPPRRPRNPFPAHPAAQGPAAAVRAHERRQRLPARGRGQGMNAQQEPGNAIRRRPTPEPDEELRRFIELAQRDEEDGWDSDELGDENGFVIRDR